MNITVSDRLGNCIISGRYGAGLNFISKTCHHDSTSIAAAPQRVDEGVIQLLKDDIYQQTTCKLVTDVR